MPSSRRATSPRAEAAKPRPTTQACVLEDVSDEDVELCCATPARRPATCAPVPEGGRLSGQATRSSAGGFADVLILDTPGEAVELKMPRVKLLDVGSATRQPLVTITPRPATAGP